MKACVNCEAEGEACFDPGQEPGAQARHQGGAPRPGARQLHPPRHPVRAAGLHGDRVRRPTTPTGTARPTSPSPARTPTTRCASPTSSCSAVEEDGDWALTARLGGRTVKTLKARDLWEKIGHAAWASRRPRHPVPHHHQRLAHLPEVGADPRVEPVLGVHVPRRHGLQPGLAEPDARSATPTSASTSPPSSTPAGCGPSCSRSPC